MNWGYTGSKERLCIHELGKCWKLTGGLGGRQEDMGWGQPELALPGLSSFVLFTCGVLHSFASPADTSPGCVPLALYKVESAAATGTLISINPQDAGFLLGFWSITGPWLCNPSKNNSLLWREEGRVGGNSPGQPQKASK